MGGRVLRNVGVPSRVHSRRGKGWREDAASGFVRFAEDYVDDVRQGQTSKQFADITPGFGTQHPQDVKNLGSLDDPSGVDAARSADTINSSKQDLNVSDAEVEASIREGRKPRLGH